MNGLSLSVHYPMKNQDDYDDTDPLYRVCSIGLLGRIDMAPQYDLRPTPCNSEKIKGLPHGGYDSELCEIYKAINTHHPEIAKFIPNGKQKTFLTVFDE
jgi:hypothetical protein